jgi:hypothetical protein
VCRDSGMRRLLYGVRAGSADVDVVVVFAASGSLSAA